MSCANSPDQHSAASVHHLFSLSLRFPPPRKATSRTLFRLTIPPSLYMIYEIPSTQVTSYLKEMIEKPEHVNGAARTTGHRNNAFRVPFVFSAFVLMTVYQLAKQQLVLQELPALYRWCWLYRPPCARRLFSGIRYRRDVGVLTLGTSPELSGAAIRWALSAGRL